MNAKPQPIHSQPDGYTEDNDDVEDVVNDALGTVDEADSTGLDDNLETGDAKAHNFNTRED